jgi:hypothetical protein
MNMEASTEMFQYLVIGKVTRTEKFVEFGPGPFANLRSEGFRNRVRG